MEKNDDNVDVVYPGGINKVIANKYLYPLISAYILHHNVKYIKIIEMKKSPQFWLCQAFASQGPSHHQHMLWFPCRSIILSDMNLEVTK